MPETQYLPWATVLMPADNAGGTGTFASGHNLKRGDIVWASLINGDSKQRLVIGVQNAVSGSSKDNPATEYQALQRYLTQDAAAGDQPNPASHATGDQPDKNPNLGSKQIGATGDEDESRQVSAISIPASNANPAGTFSVTVADGKCATDPGSKIENILGEFFATLQHTNGNIGSYYVSKYTGGIFELQSIAQGYITRVQAVVSAAISRAFGELMVQIKKGIQALIKSSVGTSSWRPQTCGGLVHPDARENGVYYGEPHRQNVRFCRRYSLGIHRRHCFLCSVSGEAFC